MLALAIGWVLHISKGGLLPIVFSVLVVYVIVGTTRIVARIPGRGSRLPTSVKYSLALLVIATIQDLAAQFGIEQPTWAALREGISRKELPLRATTASSQ